MSKGFVTSSYLNRVKPPYISGVLALIGFIFVAYGAIMLFLVKDPTFTVIPYTASILGIILLMLTVGYFLSRRWSISNAKAQEESSFQDWVENHHGLVLDKEQTDQLYNYGTTIVDGTTYFTQKEIMEDGAARIFVAKEQPVELLETGAVILPDLEDEPQLTSVTSETPAPKNV